MKILAITATVSLLALAGCATPDNASTPVAPVVREQASSVASRVTPKPVISAGKSAGSAVKSLAPKVKPKPKKTTTAAVYYANCTAAHKAHAAPLHRGDPGYSGRLDRDGDGTACE
jgi:hypothetical protein